MHLKNDMRSVALATSFPARSKVSQTDATRQGYNKLDFYEYLLPSDNPTVLLAICQIVATSVVGNAEN